MKKGLFVFRGDANADIGMGHLNRLTILADLVKKAGHEVVFALSDTDGAMASALLRGREALRIRKVHAARGECGSAANKGRTAGKREGDIESRSVVAALCERGYALPAKMIDGFGEAADKELRLKRPASATAARPADSLVPVVVISRYGIGPEYLQAYRDAGFRVVFFDDLCEFTAPCDVLINANFFSMSQRYAERYSGSGTRLLLGPKYYLLRDEFVEAAGSNDSGSAAVPSAMKYAAPGDRPPTGRAAGNSRSKRSVTILRSERTVGGHSLSLRILVTMGGSDYFNLTPRIVRELDRLRGNFEIVVVAGRANARKSELRGLAGRCASHPVSVVGDSELAGLFSSCDIAVTAGGGTNYELACLGKPLIIFPTTANERLNAKFICEEGLGVRIVLRGLEGRKEDAWLPAAAGAALRKAVAKLAEDAAAGKFAAMAGKLRSRFFRMDSTVSEVIEVCLK